MIRNPRSTRCGLALRNTHKPMIINIATDESNEWRQDHGHYHLADHASHPVNRAGGSDSCTDQAADESLRRRGGQSEVAGGENSRRLLQREQRERRPLSFAPGGGSMMGLATVTATPVERAELHQGGLDNVRDVDRVESPLATARHYL
jgi:hypothetical protein